MNDSKTIVTSQDGDSELGRREAKSIENSLVTSKDTVQWITGWRLWLIFFGSGLALFIVQTDGSITSTAIITITNDLGDFVSSYWVFTAYLLTYGGFPIIFARISDIFGRKQCLCVFLVVFLVFSGACGAARTLLQLIMFRWLQGIGASGIVAITTFYGFELRPPEKWASYGAAISSTITVSLAVAPLIGAGLSQQNHWRWVFLISVPIGATALGVALLSMPNKLALEPAAQRREPSAGLASEVSREYHDLARLDFMGAFALLGASASITAALQQAAAKDSFSSAQVVAPLVLSAILLAIFVVWQWLLASRAMIKTTPLLSWELLTNRVFLAIMLNSWLAGAIMTACIVQIPQRFVIVNNLSAIQAGVRLLPFVVLMAASSAIAAIVVGKAKIPVVNALIFAGILMVAGTAGLSQTPTSEAISISQYGFQVLAGAGVGTVNVLVILLPPYVLERKHLAVANGAVVQMRILGGALGLAITQCAASASLRRKLMVILTPQETAMFLNRIDSISRLSLDKQTAVRRINGDHYNLQMFVVVGFAAASVVAAILQWQRKAVVFKG